MAIKRFYRTADILKVDVDSSGAGVGKVVPKALGPVRDAGIEAQHPGHELNLLRGARNPNDAAAELLRDLARTLADPTTGGADHDRLARFDDI